MQGSNYHKGKRCLGLGWATLRVFWVAGKALVLHLGEGFKGVVLTSYCCRNKLLKNEWLKTTKLTISGEVQVSLTGFSDVVSTRLKSSAWSAELLTLGAPNSFRLLAEFRSLWPQG